MNSANNDIIGIGIGNIDSSNCSNNGSNNGSGGNGGSSSIDASNMLSEALRLGGEWISRYKKMQGCRIVVVQQC